MWLLKLLGSPGPEMEGFELNKLSFGEGSLYKRISLLQACEGMLCDWDDHSFQPPNLLSAPGNPALCALS